MRYLIRQTERSSAGPVGLHGNNFTRISGVDMNIEELEEALDEVFSGGFSIETDNHGQLIVYTGLTQEEDGELVPFDSEEDEDLDPALDPLEDEDADDEE
jgi:hypothetical protein